MEDVVENVEKVEKATGETVQVVPEARPKNILRFVSVIVILLVVGTGFVVYKNWQGFTGSSGGGEDIAREVDKPVKRIEPTPEEAVDKKDNLPASYSQQGYTSPGGTYTFQMLLVSRDDPRDPTCSYRLVGPARIQLGKDIIPLIGRAKVHCAEGMLGPFSNDFVGWMGEDIILFEFEEGVVRIVDLGSREARDFEYDSSKYRLALGSNNAQDIFLMKVEQDIDTSGVRRELFVLVDIVKDEVVKELDFGSYRVEPIYDWVNRGYLFGTTFIELNEEEQLQYVQTKFYFLSLEDYFHKLVLENKPVVVYGRGCAPSEIKPKVGEILFSGSCYVLDEDKYDEDRYVHIKL